MKRIPLWHVGKGLGVCSKGVLKQPQKNGKPGHVHPQKWCPTEVIVAEIHPFPVPEN